MKLLDTVHSFWSLPWNENPDDLLCWTWLSTTDQISETQDFCWQIEEMLMPNFNSRLGSGMTALSPSGWWDDSGHTTYLGSSGLSATRSEYKADSTRMWVTSWAQCLGPKASVFVSEISKAAIRSHGTPYMRVSRSSCSLLLRFSTHLNTFGIFWYLSHTVDPDSSNVSLGLTQVQR